MERPVQLQNMFSQALNSDMIFLKSESEEEVDTDSSGCDPETNRNTQKKFEKEILSLKSVITWEIYAEKIVGRNDVFELVGEAFMNPSFDKTLQRRAILLAGVPGTGKTATMTSVAVHVSKAVMKPVSVFTVRAGNLLSRFHGDSEKCVSALFKMAAKSTPAIILIDEADGLFRKRGEDEQDFVRNFKNTLLSEMEGIGHHNGAFLICSTNMPWDIDPAFIRRFSGIYFFYPPQPEERLQILDKFLTVHGKNHAIGKIDKRLIMEQTKGFTGSDIRKLVEAAIHKTSRYLVQDLQLDIKGITKWLMESGPPQTPIQTIHLTLETQMFEAALLEVSRSCQGNDHRKLKLFHKKVAQFAMNNQAQNLEEENNVHGQHNETTSCGCWWSICNMFRAC